MRDMQMPMTKTVKWLLIANVACWVVIQILGEYALRLFPATSLLGMTPASVLYRYYFWQPFTYMFLHSMDVTHILFNMLMLWWLGAELEMRWGQRFFLTYYLVCGVGAAFIYIAGMWGYASMTGNINGLTVPVVGASGALFGLMLAYGVLFGERIVHFMMLFPMKAKYMVMILGAIQLFSMITNQAGGVAYLAHLGGIIAGYIFLKSRQKWSDLKSSIKYRKRGRNLRLVVDNEKPKETPKYWN